MKLEPSAATCSAREPSRMAVDRGRSIRGWSRTVMSCLSCVVGAGGRRPCVGQGRRWWVGGRGQRTVKETFVRVAAVVALPA